MQSYVRGSVHNETIDVAELGLYSGSRGKDWRMKDWREALRRDEVPQGRILFARHDGIYVLKFVGGIHYGQNWSFDLSKALAHFLDRIFAQRDFEDIIIDLTGATSIDSTNLGLLARIAIFMQEKMNKRPTVVSTNPNINQTLHTVGFRQIFSIVEKPLGTPDAEVDLPSEGGHDVNVPRMLLVAHRTLSTLNEHNAEHFRDIVETLEDHVAQEHKTP